MKDDSSNTQLKQEKIKKMVLISGCVCQLLF